MATAVNRGGHQEIQRLLHARNKSKSLESDFAGIVIRLKVVSPKAAWVGTLNRNFEKPLSTALNDASSSSFASIISSQSTPEEAKKILLQILLKKGRKASSATLESILKALLADTSLSLSIKSIVLQDMGRLPSLAGESVFLPYLRGKDTTLKTAAYLGLGHQIRSNRHSQKAVANKRIFDNLKAIADTATDISPIRAIAQIGEAYSRDYLVVKCAGNPAKLEVVLRYDPALSHHGLIAEASKMLPSEGSANSMAEALRYGVKNPDQVITEFLGGSNADVESGLKLMKAFPEQVPKRTTVIQSHVNSPIPEIRDAATALVQ